MIDLKTFALAGDAIFTVKSRKTGNRFTFKVQASDDGQRHYVKVLTGPDNTADYTFLGTIFDKANFRHGKADKTTITPEAPSATAFRWIWANITVDLSKAVEVNHEGRCCRCGRRLTVPESVESGIGPECAAIMGI